MVNTITPEEFAIRTANQTNNPNQNPEQPRIIYMPIQNDDKLLYLILGLAAFIVIGGAIIIALSKK